METAKLFQNGSSQAVRLPKEFRMPGDAVKISRKGRLVILEPLELTWASLFDSLIDFHMVFIRDHTFNR